MGYRFLFSILILSFLAGCRQGRRVDTEVGQVEVSPVVIQRYDLDLFSVRPDHFAEDLVKLQPRYPFFLGDGFPDTASLRNLRYYLMNPRNQEFFAGVRSRFSGLTGLERELTEAFRHLRFYFPQQPVPQVVAYISGGDYEAPVQMGDGMLLIGLDNYLGPDCEQYQSDRLPLYLLGRMVPQQIAPDCIKLLSKVYFPEKLPGNNLLDYMVEAGKRLWFAEAMLSATPEQVLIAYSDVQHRWIMENEQHVWAAIIEHQMLYSADGRTIRTLMADGPFTAEFSKDSPPRLGEWIGWQIVRSYMEKHREVTPANLMEETDAQKILTQSGYKPGK
jgi:hypothetical protein